MIIRKRNTRMRWAIALTILGAILLGIFMVLLINGTAMMDEWIATWLITGFVGAMIFCLGTALL